MNVAVKALVLRETEYKESSRVLTVLSDSLGKLTVTAKGAKRRGSRTAAATQLLAYSEMSITGSRGKWYLNDASTVELFSGLRNDLRKLTIGSYFAELLEAVGDEDSPDPEILRLGLNSLYALSEGRGDDRLTKAAFEMRLMCLAGYEPSLDACALCGECDTDTAYFDLNGGALLCGACAGGDAAPLSPSSLAALRYITGCQAQKLFSFTLSGDALAGLCSVCERYVTQQLERRFRILDYLNNLE